MRTTPPAILVVDDEPQVRKVVRSVLEADGYIVTEAADGQAALMLLSSVAGPRGPHLMVLDVMMPGIDGIEVCRQIDHGRTKVVILTALDDAATRTAAEEAGADRYITKPFSAVELLDAVRELLADPS
ncbi:MAG TPA: response regulator [Acidimicrobiales bacterium]|nr:response regulator [Acidimicrobiales bacterium]